MLIPTSENQLPSVPSPFDFPESPISPLTDEAAAAPRGEKFIVFFLNEKLYAIASREVAEVTRPLPVASLPNAPAWLFGIANLRGEIVTVLDLPKILDEESAGLTGKTKFVVLQSKDFSTIIAFTVDRLSEMVALPPEQIEFCQENVAPHIFGKAAHKANVLHLIDAERLLSSLTLI